MAAGDGNSGGGGDRGRGSAGSAAELLPLSTVSLRDNVQK